MDLAGQGLVRYVLFQLPPRMTKPRVAARDRPLCHWPLQLADPACVLGSCLYEVVESSE